MIRGVAVCSVAIRRHCESRLQIAIAPKIKNLIVTNEYYANLKLGDKINCANLYAVLLNVALITFCFFLRDFWFYFKPKLRYDSRRDFCG